MTLSVTTDRDDADTADELEPDETAEAADDAEADTDAGEPATDRRWGRRLRIGAVVMIFIAALATSGYLGWQLWQDKQIEQASQQAQQAAVTYAQILTSIDSNKVDENFAQVLDGSTGEFKDMYSQSSVQLRQLLIDNKATAHGVVLDSAVQSASKDKVVVLLFVDQAVSNTSVPDPRVDRSRIKMTMENVDDRWRASKVELP
ncbi:MAG: tetratricopeptide repeat protein [Mycobacteriaceae bacterium]|nr:tetratricopeptide repeat protein [Mycobacteriaceae bacterium]